MRLTVLLYRQFGSFGGLVILLLVAMAVMALASWNIADPSLNTANDSQITNLLGFWGAAYADMAMQFFGLGAVVGLLAPFFWGILLACRRPVTFLLKRVLFWPVSTLLFSGALGSLPTSVQYWPLSSGMGGFIGDHIADLSQFFFAPQWLLSALPLPESARSIFAMTVPLLALLPCGIWSALYAGGVVGKVVPDKAREGSVRFPQSPNQLDNRGQAEESGKERMGSLLGWLAICAGQMLHLCLWLFSIMHRLLPFHQHQNVRDEIRREPAFDTIKNTNTKNENIKNTRDDTKEKRLLVPQSASLAVSLSPFELPWLDFLGRPKHQVHDRSLSREVLAANNQKLVHILEDFGVKGIIINVCPGPVVTLYEFEPAPGIKSSRIISLADDIARSMSAISARISVIAGRNAIGIELPNQTRETVFLREILENENFSANTAKLALALGKTIGGDGVIADLAKMPHLLVAGTTGSGKSVAINTMILSLLYRLTPQQCRLIMVDPKMLELSVYDGIPHLLTPVVTDPKKAIIALKWAVREMENRYRKMAKIGVRNIDGFNQRLAEAASRQETLSRIVQTGFDKQTGKPVFETEIFDYVPMPYIVVIIDEMADLMLVAGKEIEAVVQRLAQMARAAGIHVIMATQRPSVDVITGTIKANFPTRISFAVTSKIDSRTILGEQGAEQLLGQGDMLFMMGGARMSRVHGAFVGDEEVEQVVAHLKLQGTPDYLDAVMEETGENGLEGAFVTTQDSNPASRDDPYDQAVAVVVRDRKASTSYIQRRLGIGYNRAASIIERMEMEGIISSPNHAGKREILLDAPESEDVY